MVEVARGAHRLAVAAGAAGAAVVLLDLDDTLGLARVPPDHVIGSLAELLTLPAVRSGRNQSKAPETGKEFPTSLGSEKGLPPRQ